MDAPNLELDKRVAGIVHELHAVHDAIPVPWVRTAGGANIAREGQLGRSKSYAAVELLTGNRADPRVP